MVVHLDTLPKFNRKFAPEVCYPETQYERIVVQASLFRGEMLNFGGVGYFLNFIKVDDFKAENPLMFTTFCAAIFRWLCFNWYFFFEGSSHGMGLLKVWPDAHIWLSSSSIDAVIKRPVDSWGYHLVYQQCWKRYGYVSNQKIHQKIRMPRYTPKEGTYNPKN